LTEPHPRRVGDILGIFARAAHAPEPAIRINAALLGLIPRTVLNSLTALTPTRRIRKAVMKDLGLPDGILSFINYPTRFDSRDAERLLRPAGITVPPLEDYAWRLWDYWERHLDPDLFIDRSLRGRVNGRVVLISGAGLTDGQDPRTEAGAQGQRCEAVKCALPRRGRFRLQGARSETRLGGGAAAGCASEAVQCGDAAIAPDAARPGQRGPGEWRCGARRSPAGLQSRAGRVCARRRENRDRTRGGFDRRRRYRP